MTRLRVVLDTNVLLSALLFPSGSLTWLRQAWRSQDIRPLASRAITQELIRVLSYPKFRLTVAEREELLDDYLPCCEIATPPADIKVPNCRDPFDRPFLELALAAKADALLTGDKDLLALSNGFAVPIVTPAEFRSRLPSASTT